jgi:flagellin-like protein
MSKAFQDDRALAPVVGTILVIAISIVLAGGLFFMSKYIAKPPEKAPTVTFTWNELDDRLQVVTVDPDVLRSHYQLQLTVAGDFEFSGPVQPGGDALAALQFTPLGGAANGPADAPLRAGEAITICATAATEDVEIAVRHGDTTNVIYRIDIESLAACPV